MNNANTKPETFGKVSGFMSKLFFEIERSKPV